MSLEASGRPRGTLHMIGNAHIDPVWLWTWQEGRAEVLASFRSALDRLTEYEDFVFVSSSALFYSWVEEVDPDMFEEIRQRVREGRWELVGGWWLQPDCNLPSGESFVRQALYGQRYFADRFGRTPRVGYNVDSFGHHAALPQLLRKSGLDAYVFMRPKPEEQTLPARLFRWRGADGSSVMTYRLPFTYFTLDEDVEAHVRQVAAELPDAGQPDELPDVQMCFYGVGNHGGGPTRANLDSIRRLQNVDDVPELRFSTPDRFFDDVTTHGWRLPEVHGDFQHHASGCYAAHGGVKRWNRRAEASLVTAEQWASVAAAQGVAPYPEDLDRAWKAVLFNQFHDILAGTSLARAYEDARDSYGEAVAIAGRALDRATQAIAWRVSIDHQEGARPLVVFNPHAHASRSLVAFETAALSGPALVLDDRGHAVPTQRVRSEVWAEGRTRFVFEAELPSLGYRTYRLQPGRVSSQPPACREASATVLDNGVVRLEVDATDGSLVRLFDVARGLEVLAAPARAVVVADASDTWAHGVTRFDDEVGAFGAAEVELVEHGEVRSVVRSICRYRDSTLHQEFSLRAGSPQVDVTVRLDWNEPHALLKLRFPLRMARARATYEIPYGCVERPLDGEEEPGQRWLDVSGLAPGTTVGLGVSLLNDAKYAFDVRGEGDLAMTVARSPIVAHHDPIVPEPGTPLKYLDHGVQTFRYALLVHGGDWRAADTTRRALDLNHAPIVVPATFHAGPFESAGGYLSLDASSVNVGALKRAEDGDGWVLRLHETAGRPVRVEVDAGFVARRFTVALGAHEVCSLRLPADPSAPVVEVDLPELSLRGGAVIAS